ncbi:MAG: bifunctional (p)ppGpp synthetase/guanosine-3',5'-bis(diphosphate) 3'-pyrophosphohydrolase [Candidatus Magnetobacterium sp. LHC-1]|nr:bifunctional (p)ppGpp synthetase/guanosine-3',5'-bis(diphosphate) 3'-pyrophosphohydrolase [Nitrospirota bacterium]
MEGAATITLDELLGKIVSYNADANTELIKLAYHFTHEAHCDQRRREGTPYVGHPLAVASILADMHLDVPTIISGLLHDTVEDTDTTIDDIGDIFGVDVAYMVNALTKLTQMEFKTREETQAENFRKMFMAMAEDVRVILIKFADRLHNMRTLEFMPSDKQKRISAETLDIYAPLANRLGIGWLRAEFEDLGFKYLHPELYEEISRKVAEKRHDRESFIKELAFNIESKLREHGIFARVSGRVKNYYGIYQKMVKDRVPFEEVNDILGLRIITQTKDQCYMTLGIIHSMWIPVPGRFKDYIALPKVNMYQSLHTTVLGAHGERIEFQIRTEDMHMLAERGIASHWIYKEKERPIDDRDAKYFNWLRELIYMQKDSSDAKDFLEMFKGEVFQDVVFVLTPAGEIKELPTGSTPVDFAYAIHTELGNRCVGCRINGKIAPLKYHLKNGDIVEVMTSSSHTPSRDWLGFVVTHKARSRIKHWIKSEQRKQAITLGTAMLDEELRKHAIGPAILKSKRIKELLQEFGLNTLEELYVEIGYGKLSVVPVINRLKPEQHPPQEAGPTLKVRKKPTHHRGIQITGIDNLLYNTAKCCYPVPGDNVAGFITKGKGVSIHRTDCDNFQRLAIDESRMVQISWKTGGDFTTTTRLYVETIDKPGILATLSSMISTFNINLSQLEARSAQDKHAHFIFTLEVKDKVQLTNLSNKLMSADGVISVRR